METVELSNHEGSCGMEFEMSLKTKFSSLKKKKSLLHIYPFNLHIGLDTKCVFLSDILYIWKYSC